MLVFARIYVQIERHIPQTYATYQHPSRALERHAATLLSCHIFYTINTIEAPANLCSLVNIEGNHADLEQR